MNPPLDYESLLSQKTQDLKPSGIRKFFDIAAEMTGVISLSVGEPDFKTPWNIRQAGIKSLEKSKTWYTSNSGMMELRREISSYLLRKYSLEYSFDNQILVTVGGSEAIDLAIRAIVNPGDEVLIPEPSFVCYTPITELAGGIPVAIKTSAKNEFRLTADELRAKIGSKTKLLILPFPNNPTGAVMHRAHLEEIAAVLRGTNILVLSDEIYSELTYGDNRHVSFASIDDMYERTVTINGFSKSFAMTGWRMGYAAAPEPIIRQMTKVHQFAIMCAPTTSQYAAIEALRNSDESVSEMLEKYDMRRRFLVDRLNKIGLSCFTPQGAFYVFPSIQKTGLSSEEFCKQLLHQKKVAVVPGNAFGDSGEGFVRISYSYSMDHLKTALERIEDFIA